MEIFLVLIGVILIYMGGSILIILEDVKHPLRVVICSIIMLVIGMFCCIGAVEYVMDIPPIEVYRGNTTLKITYQDSIPVDSVVVYKKK